MCFNLLIFRSGLSFFLPNTLQNDETLSHDFEFQKNRNGLKKTFVICSEKEMLILVGRKSGAESEANVPDYMKRVKER